MPRTESLKGQEMIYMTILQLKTNSSEESEFNPG